MASIIHMETEVVRALAQQLVNGSNNAMEIVRSLSGMVQGLQWQGNSRYEFESEFAQMARQMGDFTDKAVLLSQVVQREVEEWENADRTFSSQYSKNVGGIQNPSIIGDLREELILLFPYSLSDSLIDLQNAPAGKDVLEQASENKITFVISETGERLGYQGDDGTEVQIHHADSFAGGHFDPADNSITIDDGILSRAKSKEDLAQVLAHEMQHAIDDKLYPPSTQGPLSDEEWNNYFDLPPERQQASRDWFADEMSKSIDSEVRAYERSEAMENQRDYSDDGIQTREERQAILDHRLNTGDYESYYEESLAKSCPGKQFDVSIDSQGNVRVDIKKAETKTSDSWWPF